MTYINSFSQGFIYCVARKGVTGRETSFSEGLAHYIDRCRNASHLPIALGFGIQEQADIDFLKGKVDIAVIGTRTITIMEEGGIEAVGDFFKNVV